jgi:hypothetical protein
LSIPGPEGGCGCSFLADSADWNAPTWDMMPETLPKLASTLRTIRQHCSEGFTFEALWIGDSATEERRLTIVELADLIEQSRIGTKSRYPYAAKQYPSAVSYFDCSEPDNQWVSNYGRLDALFILHDR